MYPGNVGRPLVRKGGKRVELYIDDRILEAAEEEAQRSGLSRHTVLTRALAKSFNVHGQLALSLEGNSLQGEKTQSCVR